MSGCIFCKIVSGEIESTKVFEDDELIAFKDLHPQAPTHVLVIPRKHIASINEAAEEDTALLGKLLLGCRRAAEQAGLTEYRTVNNCGESAGQSVFHIHMHVLGGRALGWPPG